MKELWDESLRLYSEGKLDEALDRMLALETQIPPNGGLLANIGVVYRDRGDLDRAEQYLRRAGKLLPADPAVPFNLALTLLRGGRLREGFAEYECRWRIAQFQEQHLKLPAPVWQGEPLQGRRILLYGEQGAGDVIQFVRYAPLVRAAGGEVMLTVRPDLSRLMTWLEGDYQVNQSFDAELQCPMMSLPQRFGTELGTIPTPARFRVPYDRQFPAGQRNIGVAWAGNRRHPNDRERSIPAECFAPMASVPGVRCWSLQVGASDVPEGIEDLAAELTDFAATAVAICGLDLVITVDTAVAHLAGSLGKPVWLLVAPASDWRWMLELEDTPWYPTMRIFRRKYGEEWKEVIGKVIACLTS